MGSIPNIAAKQMYMDASEQEKMYVFASLKSKMKENVKGIRRIPSKLNLSDGWKHSAFNEVWKETEFKMYTKKIGKRHVWIAVMNDSGLQFKLIKQSYNQNK
jgi:hypothetical protein